MRLPTLRCRRFAVDRCCEQRVCETEPVAIALKDARRQCLLKPHLVCCRRVDKRGRGLSERSRVQERAPRTGAQRREPVANRRRQALRHGRLLARSEPALPRHGLGDLQREKGIPSRDPVDGVPARLRERDLGMRADDPLELPERERPQHDARDPLRSKSSVNSQRRPGSVASYRCQQPDALAADEAPEHEPERVARRRVKPLRVVDRDNRRLTQRQTRDSGERPTGQGDPIQLIRRIGAPKRGLERAALRRRKRREQRLRDGLHEIRERDEREPGLRLGGPADQDAKRPRARRSYSGAPDRRLADARHAAYVQRSRPRHQHVEERLDRRDLLVAPDQLPSSGTPMSPSSKRAAGPLKRAAGPLQTTSRKAATVATSPSRPIAPTGAVSFVTASVSVRV